MAIETDCIAFSAYAVIKNGGRWKNKARKWRRWTGMSVKVSRKKKLSKTWNRRLDVKRSGREDEEKCENIEKWAKISGNGVMINKTFYREKLYWQKKWWLSFNEIHAWSWNDRDWEAQSFLWGYSPLTVGCLFWWLVTEKPAKLREKQSSNDTWLSWRPGWPPTTIG